MATKPLITNILCAAGGVVVGFVACAGYGALNASPATVAGSASSHFTNPILSAGPVNESLTIAERQTLQQKVSDLITAAKGDKTILEAAVYFRDLNNGPSFGVNSNLKFSPASLLKVPLAIAYYKELDTTPDLLSQQIQFTGPKGQSVEHYPPPQSVAPGNVYTIEDLLNFMLKDSDNDATNVLFQYLGADKVNQVYSDLGIQTVQNYSLYQIDVQTYAAFFRILYNATYIDQPSSEAILDKLSQSTFKDGLAAGVPAGVSVAHKFGERTIDDKAPVYQLHDCGIVYAPHNPYVLCVMTQGANYDTLATFISKISGEVYKQVTAE